MSPEEFDTLILSGKISDLRQAFSGLDEKTRKSLSKPAQTAFSSISRNKPAKGASAHIRKFVEGRKGDVWNFWNAPVNTRAGLALYAVAPLSGVKRQNLWVHGDGANDALFGILEDRRPDWLGDWVQWKLEQEWHGLDFTRIYSWIKNGLMEKPDTPEYYGFYIQGVDVYVAKKYHHGIKPTDYIPLSTRLHNDPNLLADALKVFKYENGAFSSDKWRAENAHPVYEPWSDALLKLLEMGDLTRNQLLDDSLGGLSEDLKNNQLSSNHKFHIRLDPTLDEIAAREAQYRQLLAHPTGHVAKFALTQMAALDKAGRADRDALLSELPIVLQGSGIGNAKSALRLAGLMAKSDAALKPAVLTAILPVLDHQDAGLQEAGLKILAQYEDALTADHKSEIERAVDFLAASLRPQAYALIGKDLQREIVQDVAEDLDALLSEVQFLPADMKTHYGLAKILESGPFSPALISSDIRDMRVLHLAEPITPIQTHDELYTAIAKALETVESASEIELIIDGISRLGRNSSPDFAQRLAPLIQRLKSGGTGTGRGLTQTWNALGYGLIDLVQAWATGKLSKRNVLGKYYPHNRAAQPMIGHMGAISQRVTNGRLQNRLCTLTHTGGWIDPRIWVDRAQTLIDSSQKSDVPDVCYSLLRLAPDYRDEAAQRVNNLPQPWRAVGRFLFRLDDRPDLSAKVHPAIWICAARARDPYADWTDALSELRLVETAADGLRPAAYHWKTETTEEKRAWSKRPFKVTQYKIEARPASSAEGTAGKGATIKPSLLSRFKPKTVLSAAAIPTASLAADLESNPWNGGAGSGWLFEWMTLFWPQNPASIYARATHAFGLDDESSTWSTGHGYLHALFQPNRSWGETGHLLIARGLAAKNADIRGYIIDALIEGSESGQFDPDLLAITFAKMINEDSVKLGRVAEGFSRVSEVSPLHAALVSICLSGFLPKIDRKTHAMSAMMELWLETLAASGRAADETGMAWLSGFSGSSKAAKAAKKIRALTFIPALNSTVKAQAIQTRLTVLP